MKKTIMILCLFVIGIMCGTAYASGIEESGYSLSDKVVYIEGNLNRADNRTGDTVTLTLLDSNDKTIKYIDQTEVTADGKYFSKFKFGGDITNCELNVKEGKNDVTKSVSVSKVTVPTVYAVTFKSENGGNVINANECFSAAADISNKYGTDKAMCMYVAFYDANSVLIGIDRVFDGVCAFDEISKQIGTDRQLDVPDKTQTIKAFLWANTTSAIPLSRGQEKQTGDKKFSGNGDEITVAFIGDSITHQGNYLKMIEHYYQTRYPQKRIKFVIKGIGGNVAQSIIDRFDWDITGDELSGKIDEATLMVGTNDIGREMYKDDPNENAAAKAAAIEAYENNVREIIKKCKEKNISLTLITPPALDDTEGFAQATGPMFPRCNTDGIKKAADVIKRISDEYKLPLIDFWTKSTETNEKIRKSGYDGEIITDNDRVHPSELGGFYLSYLFIKQQDESPVVASVDIDAKSKSISCVNSDVTVNNISQTEVSYTYMPKAIPMAYTESYKKWENDWDCPVTEEINREIIKINSLDSGTYEISFDGKGLSKTYTADELAEGVNIAIDEKNPGQIQAKESFEILREKINHESDYREIALTEQFMRSLLKMSDGDIKYGDYSDLKTAAEKLAEIKPGFKTAFLAYAGKYSNGAEGKIGYGYKPNRLTNWADLRNDEQRAKEAALPKQHRVTVHKINQ